jgi:hypothetical protein
LVRVEFVQSILELDGKGIIGEPGPTSRFGTGGKRNAVDQVWDTFLTGLSYDVVECWFCVFNLREALFECFRSPLSTLISRVT